MRFHRHAEAEEESHGIDLAPMLDFFLNLLIFFIITAAFVTESGIKVNRPSAQTAVKQEKSNILVAISKTGEIWIDRQHVDIRALRAIIQKMKLENPNATVIVQADKDARASLLVEAMDQARMAGVKDVAIATIPK
jgi:biopolymer transport protein ExbD